MPRPKTKPAPIGKRRSDAEFQTDVLVGKRIRAGRALRGMNQTDLGEAVGLTFQQVQKWENASNRVAVSRLVTIAHALSLPVDWFLADLDLPVDPDPEATAEAQKLAARIARLPDFSRVAVEQMLKSMEFVAASSPERKAAE